MFFIQEPQSKLGCNNESNVKLLELQNKKFFKFYETAILIFTVYVSLIIHKHGISTLFVYYLLMLPALIFSSDLISQIEDNPSSSRCLNIRTNYVTTMFLKIFGTDYYLTQGIQLTLIKNHLYAKFYITLLAPLVIYSSL